jgi:hypothetical protein
MMLLTLTLVAALLQPPGAPRPYIPIITTMPTMKTIDKGDHSNMDEAKHAEVKTESAWKQLWQQHSPDRPRPAVDFTKEMVVAVFLGSRPTAGYRVEIASATETNGALVVRYREAAPPRGMMTAQVITSPYHIVTVPFFPGDVKFEKVQP